MSAPDTTNMHQLNQRVGEIMGEVRAVKNNVDDLKDGMLELTKAMTSVVRLEVKHDQAATTLQALHVTVATLGTRVASIESKMPGLVETRAWVVRALLGVAAVVGLAIWTGYKP